MEQHELYENARQRVRQKKRLYYHFVMFLVGSILFYVLNKLFNIGEDNLGNWYLWAILLWFVILILHTVDVFITKKFMGKEWERRQTEKLVQKQENKIEQLAKKMEDKTQTNSENISE
jgi:phosphotransferase system  glucose/maltose/N-acetylglucosamine-specific IIC component